MRPPGPPVSAVAEPRATPTLEPTAKTFDPCVPPFVIDKNNVKRFKPECL
ncbi:MAG: hypothetical protein JNK04_10085 [Myxococcales bacterium]|nr:hypothetical protein [Myxococcales bacterium]